MWNPLRFLRTIADTLLVIARELGRIRQRLTDAVVVLEKIERNTRPPEHKIVKLTITPGPTRPKGTKRSRTMAGVQLDQSLEQAFTTTYTRDDGTPNVTPDNVEITAVTPDTVAVFPMDPAAAGFTVVPLVSRGLGQVKIAYDADLGAGVVNKEELFDVEIVGGTIASIAIAGGATRPKREIPPADGGSTIS